MTLDHGAQNDDGAATALKNFTNVVYSKIEELKYMNVVVEQW